MILESHTPSEKSDKKSNSCNYLDIFESEILQSLTSYMGYVWYDVCKDQKCYSTSQVLKKKNCDQNFNMNGCNYDENMTKI